MPSTQSLPSAADASHPSRLYFADNLRVALTIMVALYHLAPAYGGFSAFYYVEPPSNDPLAYLSLLTFDLFNQAYFMGFFFLLAGYFTPASFERKGTTAFLKDRLVRLVPPIIIYTLLLNPIVTLAVYQMPASLIGNLAQTNWLQLPSLIAIGPLWFVEMLLLYDAGYASVRRAAKRWNVRPLGDLPFPGTRAVIAFTLVLALVSYLWRIVTPIGASTPVVQFPSPAYLPQYLSFFALGVIGARRDWLRRVPVRLGAAGLVATVLATALLFPVALNGSTKFFGNGHWQSAVYTLWDSIVAVGLGLALIVVFRRCFNRQGRLSRFLSQNAFTVYVIHLPIVVWTAVALRGIALENLLKFGLAALISIPLCFALAALIRGLWHALSTFIRTRWLARVFVADEPLTAAAPPAIE